MNSAYSVSLWVYRMCIYLLAFACLFLSFLRFCQGLFCLAKYVGSWLYAYTHISYVVYASMPDISSVCLHCVSWDICKYLNINRREMRHEYCACSLRGVKSALTQSRVIGMSKYSGKDRMKYCIVNRRN